MTWWISGIIWKQKIYYKKLQNLSLMTEQLAHKNLTNRPGNYGTADVVTDRSFPFDVLWITFLDFLKIIKKRVKNKELLTYTCQQFQRTMSQCQELLRGNTHSPVCRLLKSISNSRPRKPRPLFVWDVEQVLKYIDSGQVNNGFNNKDTTLKTVALVDPCIFQRGSKVFQFDT